MPATASAMFSAYASIATSVMLVRSLANDLIPFELRSYLFSTIRNLFTPLSSNLTLLVDEFSGMTRNQVFDAAETYLRTKVGPATSRLRISKAPRQRSIIVAIDEEGGEEIDDEFEGIRITWRFFRTEPKGDHDRSGEKRLFEITFDKKYKDRVLGSYLPYVLIRAGEIKRGEREVKLYSRECPFGASDDGGGGGGGIWGSINLDHPSTFETLALDPEMKKAIMEDLDRFVRRREFYRKVGKAWKRGYLLYGPPGTGKSSLIAAMANYLKFDIYDLDLTSIYSNSDLRRVLLSTTNRSILVMEDIDCSVDLQNRQYDEGWFEASNPKLTLSGLLNFIDGLWSSCGDERIIVFTTNHKERLDPALLRPGRMDMHIHMSYCTTNGFKTLASNYLGINDSHRHRLCGEIEGLIDTTTVTPAEVAEELMKSDNKDVALEGLASFLKRKKGEDMEKKEKESVEAGVVIEGVVKFLKRKKVESVKKKDEEGYNAVVALEGLVELVKRNRAEAKGAFGKENTIESDTNEVAREGLIEPRKSKRVRRTCDDDVVKKTTVRSSRRRRSVVRKKSKRRF
ncbi:hypothetical protein TIFTF001_002401 [Ficus carica]|uniref:AAA+ ATPase domain-containing protein n=1 Tax=Ficus carica TaxID=3494 RepID=A0AA88CS46_FICCA|nr:hypothetical protein TIFTF001_002401 [Ficus carica]